MNIAVFIKRTTFHKNYGGLETQNKTLCEGLVAKGHKVTVFSPKYELKRGYLSQTDVNYRFVGCSYRSLAGFAHLAKNNWENRSVEAYKEVNAQEKFDIILAQSSSGLGVLRHKKELKIPVISISHGTTTGEYKTLLQSIKSVKDLLKLIPNTGYFLLNFFIRQRAFILKSNKVIAVSSVVKKALVDETFVAEENIVVIHNGVDELKIKPKDDYKVESKLTLLFASKVIKSKGIGDLLSALEDEGLRHVGAEILGSGEDWDYFKEISEKKGLQNRVFFREGLVYEDYLLKISESDVLVIPSRRVEGFPMTAPEAMFAGLPVIGSDMGGTPESIEEGVTGFVYKSGDIQGLIDAIQKFVDSPGLVETMGKAAYLKAKREFSSNAMLNKYEKVMVEALR